MNGFRWWESESIKNCVYVQARHDGGGGALGSVLHWRQRPGPGLGHPGVDTPPKQHTEEEK